MSLYLKMKKKNLEEKEEKRNVNCDPYGSVSFVYCRISGREKEEKSNLKRTKKDRREKGKRSLVISITKHKELPRVPP